MGGVARIPRFVLDLSVGIRAKVCSLFRRCSYGISVRRTVLLLEIPDAECGFAEEPLFVVVV